MAQITRLQSAALARALGLREGQLAELSEIVVPVLNIEPYLLPTEGAAPVPAPVAIPGGLEPQQLVGTGAFNTPLSTNRSGVINAWGAGAVVGVDPPNKFSRVAAPPTAPYEIWGGRIYLGMARGAFGEFNGVLQLTNGTTTTEERLFGFATDNHEANANFRTDYRVLLPVPYKLAANQQLFFKWQINNLTTSAQDYDIQMDIWWRYS